MMSFSSTSASLSRAVRSRLPTSVRTFAAAIDVEHGRGQWKTYGNVENYKPGKFQIKTFNKLSPVGLERFDQDEYEVVKGEDGFGQNAHAILLRSHKLQEDDVPHTTRAIARYDQQSEDDTHTQIHLLANDEFIDSLV